MKYNILLFVIATTLLFSCSSDDGGQTEEPDQNSIVGVWDAVELQIDDQTASDDAKNGRDALNFLTAKDCFIITFTFNQDLTVIAENSVNYLEIGVNSQGTGIDIPCPTEKDTDTSTYTFDGTELAIVDDQGMTITTNVTINGDTMAIDASDLDVANFNASGELIFKRR
ncbi:hypothetical protein FK220_003560 [Flavobacteriaceae bacterium TP-CH-4]|uniref:Lipocalin-like domain-containing protein n=1 Tax=Pelagihabitans pacificus TaxID=2696054 RepID=A0A967AQ71_9FLAO|nr:hypothetical protein [Pelagihabitans pacificus]NHF58401.1 hypothetical protein [Pelagihabitans pacificus]